MDAMKPPQTATEPRVWCVCSHLIAAHDEFTDQCSDCDCRRPRPEAKPERLL